MRIIAAIFAILISSVGYAQSDFSVTWDVTGLQDGSDDIISVTYDIDLGTQYVSAHGAVNLSTGLSVPSTGTCFISSTDNVFCNLSFGTQIIVLDIGGDALSGTIRKADGAGIIDSGTVILSDIL